MTFSPKCVTNNSLYDVVCLTKLQNVNPRACLMALPPWGNMPGGTWQQTGGTWSLDQPEIYHWWQYVGLILSRFPGAPRCASSGWICLLPVLLWMSCGHLSFWSGRASGCQHHSTFLSLPAPVPSSLPPFFAPSWPLSFLHGSQKQTRVLSSVCSGRWRQCSDNRSPVSPWTLNTASVYQNPRHDQPVSCQCCEHDSKGTGSMPQLSQPLGIWGSHPGTESWLRGPALNYRTAELSPGPG